MKEVPPIRRAFLRVTGSLAWVDFTGQTPFLTAALAGDLTVMRLLLKHGADPKIATFEGTTPLMAAAGVNWVFDQTYDEGPKALLEAVKLCHELGIDVNAVNSMGLTAVHGAANRGSDDIIRFLVEKGAKLDVKDKEGRTPMTWAEGVFLATHPGETEAELDCAAQEPDDRTPGGQLTMRNGIFLSLVAAGLFLVTMLTGQAKSRDLDDAQTEATRQTARPPLAPVDAAFLKQVLPHVPQRSAPSRAASRSTGSTRRRSQRMRDVGKGRPQDQDGDDAAERRAAARASRARCVRRHARIASRSQWRCRRQPSMTPALHRLNRTEYANAIRDLLDLEVDVSPLLPADGSSEGFDNIAEALSVSPSLIQGYVSAAMKISRLAVGDRTLPPSQIIYPAPPALAQDRHIDGLPLGTRGGMLVHHTFPLDAEYEFSSGAGGARGRRRGGADVTIDGEKVTGTNRRGLAHEVTAGPHTIGVAVIDRQRGAGVDDIYSDFRTDAVVYHDRAACRASPSWDRSIPPAPATRRADAVSSSAARLTVRRRAPTKRPPARARSSPRSRGARIAAR